MAITLEDVAREAGVHKTTVSHVLHNRPRQRVSEETRARIWAAAHKLGYQPNLLAQALRRKETRQIVYLEAIAESDAMRQLEGSLVTGLTLGLRQERYQLTLHVPPAPGEVTQALRSALGSGLYDGGILRSRVEDLALWSAVKELSKPVVVLGWCSDPEVTSISVDFEARVRLSLHHFRERGHRRVGLITGPPVTDFYRLSRSAWTRLAPEYGLETEGWVGTAQRPEEGRALAEQWWAQSEGPTAVLCLPERAALGLGRVGERHGPRVGAELDLIIAGSQPDPWIYPEGTWFCGVPLGVLGQEAAAALTGLLRGDVRPGPQRIVPTLMPLSPV